MFRNKSVDLHQFSMIPKAEIPRSSFRMQKTHKTTFDCGYLVPVYVDEVLPGDTFNLRMTAFARLATPIFPMMDNMYLDSFFFFVPYRLVWTNWVKFMGQQDNPGDSISFVIPQQVSPNGGYAVNSLQDWMGLPTVGQVTAGQNVSHSALPLRAYNLIYNEWFRDENLQPSQVVDKGDGPDNVANYQRLTRGKRHDYFTSCLPFLQKGTAVSIPLGTQAIVRTSSTDLVTGANANGGVKWRGSVAGAAPNTVQLGVNAGGIMQYNATAFAGAVDTVYPSNLYADLSTATAATINQLRQSFQIQKLLERDARGGTRYTEIIRSHFGVVSPDARLQRPEYLGGGSTRIAINPIAQTSATGVTGGTTPTATLAAYGTAVSHDNGFTQSFVEHGIVIGLVHVRADLTYQQGLRRMWSRSTRYDFYFPAFAALGEQAVLNKEIYVVGSGTGGLNPADQDMQVFGYQERWAEYRYNPSQISGLFKSTSSGTIDGWHCAEKFTALPALNNQFISSGSLFTTLQRNLAVGAAANGQQMIFDSFFDIKAARPMPMYSVPGLIDHF